MSQLSAREKLELLREVKGSLQTQLEELTKDLLTLESSRGIKHDSKLPHNSNHSFASRAEGAVKNTKELNLNKRLRLCQLFTGFNVIDTNVWCLHHPDDELGYLYRYKMNASIGETGFCVEFTTDEENFTDLPVDRVPKFSVADLNVAMHEESHQREMSECLGYFARNPSSYSYLFICLQKYSNFVGMRSAIFTGLLDQHPQHYSYELSADHLHELRCSHEGSQLYKLVWKIVWNRSSLTLQSSLVVEVLSPDEEFCADVRPLFKRLAALKSDDCFDEVAGILRNAHLAVRHAASKRYIASPSP